MSIPDLRATGFASDNYDPDDYILDYDECLKLIGKE